MADVNRNLLIYPNLVVNDIMAVTVRTFMPSAPDRMDVTAWELAPRDELPALRQRRLDSFLTFLGPAGFATPDDVEALESCQQGFSQRRRGVERHLPRHGRGPRRRTTSCRCARSGGSGSGRWATRPTWRSDDQRRHTAAEAGPARGRADGGSCAASLD